MKLSDLTIEQLEQFRTILAKGLKVGETATQVSEYIFVTMGLEFSERTIQRYMMKLRNGKKIEKPVSAAETKADEMDGKQVFNAVGSETATWDYWTKKRIRTLDEVLEKCEVDLSLWDVERWECTSWEVGAKNDKKKMVIHPLFRVAVKFKAKKGWNTSEFKKILVEDLKKLAPSYKNLITTQELRVKEPILAEISLFDSHFGKLAWEPETGQDYDLNICRTRYMNAGRDLVKRCLKESPERFLYVLGNDMFHTDHKGLTTAGTPMDTDGRWQKAFQIGIQCAITLTEEMAQHAPVDVLIVPGNHDREKAFCMGEVLDARFHQHHGVSVLNQPNLTSYYRYGKVLLGFVHGDNHCSETKRNQLPQMMATDRPLDWSETVWREFHLGHFHSEHEVIWRQRSVSHVKDVAVRILPSLSSTDAWHREQGYMSVLAAEAHLYHKERGRWGYLTHTVEA